MGLPCRIAAPLDHAPLAVAARRLVPRVSHVSPVHAGRIRSGASATAAASAAACPSRYAPATHVHSGLHAPLQDAVYGHAEVAEIVQYAYERGIRVLPEFDVPAHAAIWGVGYPNLTLPCAAGQTLLNPTDEGGVYEVIAGLLAEFRPLFFTADVIHFGGDEVQDLTCWNQSSEVQAFMVSKGLPGECAARAAPPLCIYGAQHGTAPEHDSRTPSLASGAPGMISPLSSPPFQLCRR